MEGIGAANKMYSRSVIWLALVAAVVVHLIVLGLELRPVASDKTDTVLTELYLEIEPLAEVKEETSTDNSKVTQKKDFQEMVEEESEEPKPEENIPPTPIEQFKDVLLSKDKQTSKPIAIPSIYNESFTELIRDEAKEAVSRKSEEVRSFTQSFSAPIEGVRKNIERETGPLGGGNYKIRKNDVECQTLTMVPQSFEDFNNGTISTSGMCRDLKKKFNLTDKDGKIRNSNRYD